MTFRTHRVTLELPVIPRRFAAGDRRNFTRWHAWVEAVKVLADHFKADAAPSRSPRARARRAS